MNERDSWIQEVDSALQAWHQGDCVLGEHWFVHRFNPQQPLTTNAIDVVQEEETDLAESEVKGFVVVSQTCDIVPRPSRSSLDRPFIEIVPLVEIDNAFLEASKVKGTSAQFLDEVMKGKRPRFAYIHGVAELYLVADLDRVMTVEKSVVASWDRISGCENDEEVRGLGRSLARKRNRFAFPDDFNRFVGKLQSRMTDKHSKNSTEGLALRALREIRVRAEPSWDSPEVRLIFWFVREADQHNFQQIEWSQWREQWLDLIPTSERFTAVEGLVVGLEDMTAKDYVESDLLDLGHLSS